MHVAIVLPPRESFSAEGGAVASVVAGHLRSGRMDARVIGRRVQSPWPGLCPVQPGAWSSYAGAVARALRHDPPALVEVHNRPEIALALAREHRTSLLLHNDPQDMRGARTETLRRRLAALVEVRAVSPWVAGRFGEGAAVLPNGIDLAAIRPADIRDPVILFVGRVVADKGADIFVEACGTALHGLAGWRAEILGADRFGPDSPETPFLRRLRGRAAAAGVALRGWMPRDAVLAAMARAAIVVMPGRWPEPFGLVALEAMASGAALVFRPSGGLPDLVGAAGLAVAAPEPAAFGEAIATLARDPARCAALGAAGRGQASRFDIARTAARLDALRAAALAAWPGGLPHPI